MATYSLAHLRPGGKCEALGATKEEQHAIKLQARPARRPAKTFVLSTRDDRFWGGSNAAMPHVPEASANPKQDNRPADVACELALHLITDIVVVAMMVP